MKIPFIEPDDPSDREEQLIRDDASRGVMDWLPTYERPGSLVDDDHTWEGLCAAMTTLVGTGKVEIEAAVLKECGVTIADLESWWREHQREDRIRRYRDKLVADLARQQKGPE